MTDQIKIVIPLLLAFLEVIVSWAQLEAQITVSHYNSAVLHFLKECGEAILVLWVIMWEPWCENMVISKLLNSSCDFGAFFSPQNFIVWVAFLGILLGFPSGKFHPNLLLLTCPPPPKTKTYTHYASMWICKFGIIIFMKIMRKPCWKWD